MKRVELKLSVREVGQRGGTLLRASRAPRLNDRASLSPIEREVLGDHLEISPETLWRLTHHQLGSLTLEGLTVSDELLHETQVAAPTVLTGEVPAVSRKGQVCAGPKGDRACGVEPLGVCIKHRFPFPFVERQSLRGERAKAHRCISASTLGEGENLSCLSDEHVGCHQVSCRPRSTREVHSVMRVERITASL